VENVGEIEFGSEICIRARGRKKGRPSIGFRPPTVLREVWFDGIVLLFASIYVLSAGEGVQVEIGLPVSASTYLFAFTFTVGFVPKGPGMGGTCKQD
jgi:hypothetical protein